MRSLLATLWTIIFAAANASAQQLRFDEATGNYRLRYFSTELGRDVEIEIVPPNKISPQLRVTRVARDADRYVYSYEIGNGATPRSAQAVHKFELPCAEGTELSAPDGWAAHTRRPLARTGNAPRCVFLGLTTDGVQPGGRVGGYGLAGSGLPVIRPANFWGASPAVRFHPDETQEHDAELHDLIQTVSGVRGGWLTAQSVAPVRDPQILTPASRGLDVLRDDVGLVCGDLRWITNTGVCHSLQTKLDQAARSLERGRPEAARDQLRSFLEELDAQHGDEPGKHVTDNAYWLLRINAEFLLSTL